jgi:hypothetical protein
MSRLCDLLKDAPCDSAVVLESYLHAWSVYSYVCPRAACVLRELQLMPGQTLVRGVNLYAERESDYRVQGVDLFARALVPIEPHVLVAFGQLVCQCLAGLDSALERLPVLKGTVSSYIQMHDCSCLFSEFVPKEALSSARSHMQVQPADDETALYTCSGGLEETMLKAGSYRPAAACLSFIALCRLYSPGSRTKLETRAPLTRSKQQCLQSTLAPTVFAIYSIFLSTRSRCSNSSTCSIRSWFVPCALLLKLNRRLTLLMIAGASGNWMVPS